MSPFFARYGELCATHPWEVIVGVVAITSIFLSIDYPKPLSSTKSFVKNCPGCVNEQYNATDLIIMTTIRCFAILYTYHQFRNLQKLGSKYILGVAGLFIVFSSFVFTSTVLNILNIDLVDLKDALFFFLLLIDLNKAATLAQFALTASTHGEVSSKIARGMSILGPTMTLDTIVETLVIGVGTFSGVQRLEQASYFGCFSVLVNYVIFMTFYPSCLSLTLELSRISNFYGEKQSLVTKSLHEENKKSNRAVQRVKLIMSIGLLLVHIHCRWSFFGDGEDLTPELHEEVEQKSSLYSYIMKQIVGSADHIVILILLLTLMVKFVFFESKDYLIEQSRIESSLLQEELSEKLKLKKNESEDSNSRRNLETCLELYRSELGATKLSDEEILLLIDTKHIPSYNLEKAVKDSLRGVQIRRQMIENVAQCRQAIENIPYKDLDYSAILGACCENVIGYVTVPLGVAGPLLLDDKMYYIPMATSEGCLVASTNRGCRAVEKKGIKSSLISDGMTRGPVVRFTSISRVTDAINWLEDPKHFELIKDNFDSTSRFAKLTKITTRIAGRYLFIRFVAQTGDAMGMNMVSKGTEKALQYMQETRFGDMEILSLSGNFCTDKKSSAVNWIEGRGKSVVCEAIISADVVSSVLKTSTAALVDLNYSKNMIGSAMAGSIGGFNAHASNIVTAIFIATGQDPAQNITSSNCITIMEPWGDHGRDLYISCSMPSVELGTVGGGTILPAQGASLEMLGVRGPHEENPGENAKNLAKIVCAAVLAGELSLMAALATGHLVKSHLKYNRSCSEKDDVCSEQIT